MVGVRGKTLENNHSPRNESGHGGERWIEKSPVDGYNHERKLVLQYHGCSWHGCPRCYPNRGQILSHGTKTAEDLYQATKKRTAHLRKVGYKVVECWSCQWLVPGGADKHGEEPPKPKQKVTHTLFYTILRRTETETSGKEPTGNLTIENKHIPISVSVGDTLEREPTHICEREPKVLVQKFMEELRRREKNIRAKVRAEFMPADIEPATKRSKEKNRRMVRPGANTRFQLRKL